MLSAKLILAGCGKMGRALLEGWLLRGVQREHICIVEVDAGRAAELRAAFGGVIVVESAARVPDTLRPDAVVFAVKPQNMDGLIDDYARFAGEATVFLSIAAGRPIRFFEKRLGARAAMVRAMPNTPAAVRRGMTVAVGNARVTPDKQRLCHDLLESVGEVRWVEDEGWMDAVTAVSGTGPAYVFLLTECLAEAGVEAGLPAALSAELARNTVAGAGELLRGSTDSPEILRQNVTTPGGTTEAAMDVLLAPDGLDQLMIRAVAKATKRSRDLGG